MSGPTTRTESTPAALGFSMPTVADLDPRHDMRRKVEASVTAIAHGSGAVILGRGAVVVLAGASTAYHVRL